MFFGFLFLQTLISSISCDFINFPFLINCGGYRYFLSSYSYSSRYQNVTYEHFNSQSSHSISLTYDFKQEYVSKDNYHHIGSECNLLSINELENNHQTASFNDNFDSPNTKSIVANYPDVILCKSNFLYIAGQNGIHGAIYRAIGLNSYDNSIYFTHPELPLYSPSFDCGRNTYISNFTHGIVSFNHNDDHNVTRSWPDAITCPSIFYLQSVVTTGATYNLFGNLSASAAGIIFSPNGTYQSSFGHSHLYLNCIGKSISELISEERTINLFTEIGVPDHNFIKKYDFNDGVPTSATLVGSSTNYNDTYGGHFNTPCVKLVDNQLNSIGSIIFDPLLSYHSNLTVYGLHLSWYQKLNGMGDGMSLLIGTVPFEVWGEDGLPSGTTFNGLTVSMDIFNNSVSIYWNNEFVIQYSTPAFISSAFLPWQLDIDVSTGLLTLSVGRVIIFQDINVRFTPLLNPRIGFSAKTGTEFTSVSYIDDLYLQFILLLPPSTSPSFSPSLIPTASPSQFYCSPFEITSSTNSANQNTVNCELYFCPNIEIKISLCDGSICSGDTYLRLFNSIGHQIAENDDSCDQCSTIITTVPSCGMYTLKQGCYSSAFCSGMVSITSTPLPFPNISIAIIYPNDNTTSVINYLLDSESKFNFTFYIFILFSFIIYLLIYFIIC